MKENAKLKLMYEFRNQLILFLDELIEQFPDESDLIIIRIFMKDQIPVYDVIGRYIRDLLPLKEQIIKKDARFFLDNKLLYINNNISDDKINHFKELWCSNRLDDNDRNMIWEWMNLLNKIADQYFKNFGYVTGWEKI